MSKPQFVSVPVTLDFKVEPWSIDKFDDRINLAYITYIRRLRCPD